MRSLRVIISGGGTGGHIFPAIAIANKLKRINKDTEILFVGAKGRMEMEKVPQAGYKIEGLWISGLQRKLTIKNLSFPFKVIASIMKAKSIVKQFKPDVTIGVGGYASGPLMYAATSKGIPTLIQEQNSFPGITNKILAKRVDRICVAYDEMDKFFEKEKIVLTGNPVREKVIEVEGKKQEAANFFGIDDSVKTILVVGGSQGALSINKSLVKGLSKLKEAEIQMIWQTGKLSYQMALDSVNELGYDGIKVVEFIDRMDYAYASADIVISRAGAMAVSELSLVGVPTIFVPLPTAAEDHQTQNAMSLVKHNAAWLVEDKNAPSQLVDKAIELINDKNICSKMTLAIKSLGRENAVDKIVDEIESLVKNKKELNTIG